MKKTTLWKLGLKKEGICPYCKNKLVPHYGEIEGFESYDCKKKNCEFNKIL